MIISEFSFTFIYLWHNSLYFIFIRLNSIISIQRILFYFSHIQLFLFKPSPFTHILLCSTFLPLSSFPHFPRLPHILPNLPPFLPSFHSYLSTWTERRTLRNQSHLRRNCLTWNDSPFTPSVARVWRGRMEGGKNEERKKGWRSKERKVGVSNCDTKTEKKGKLRKEWEKDVREREREGWIVEGILRGKKWKMCF